MNSNLASKIVKGIIGVCGAIVTTTLIACVKPNDEIEEVTEPAPDNVIDGEPIDVVDEVTDPAE